MRLAHDRVKNGEILAKYKVMLDCWTHTLILEEKWLSVG